MTTENIYENIKMSAYTGAVSRIEALTRHDAVILFKESKLRLLDVNNWHRLCGKGHSLFHLTDQEGNPIEAKQPEPGNLLKVSSSHENTSHYNWFKVEGYVEEKNFLKDEEIYGFTVKQVNGPQEKNNDKKNSSASSTSISFLVIRNANTVTALERDKKQPASALEVVISRLWGSVVAAAATMGLATSKWKCLMKGIIRTPSLNFK
jgi:hypothetical protein